ncbi:MAG: hypothetical protein JNL13_07110 [Chitinophagaceae bacterium]|nr:hypothetical protein [Chitinophagaceae bacterium]
MNSINRILMLLGLPCAALFIPSCRCGGCDDIYTTKGARLMVHTPLINLPNTYPKAVLSVRDSVVISKGDRRCMNKDLKVCLQDGLVAKRLTLVCKRDLQLTTGSIPAGTDLFGQPDIAEEKAYSPMSEAIWTVVLKPAAAFDTGTYTFILSGATKDGVAIRDTGFIVCR